MNGARHVDLRRRKCVFMWLLFDLDYRRRCDPAKQKSSALLINPQMTIEDRDVMRRFTERWRKEEKTLAKVNISLKLPVAIVTSYDPRDPPTDLQQTFFLSLFCRFPHTINCTPYCMYECVNTYLLCEQKRLRKRAKNCLIFPRGEHISALSYKERPGLFVAHRYVTISKFSHFFMSRAAVYYKRHLFWFIPHSDKKMKNAVASSSSLFRRVVALSETIIDRKNESKKERKKERKKESSQWMQCNV